VQSNDASHTWKAIAPAIAKHTKKNEGEEMKKETIALELSELFRIVFGILFVFFSGYVLVNEFVLSYLFLLIGIGFLSLRFEYSEKKEK